MPRGRVFVAGIIVLLLSFFLLIFLVNLGSDLDSIQKQLTFPIRQLLDSYRVITVLLALALIFGGLAVVAMAISSEDEPNGLPLTDITPGIYEIAFMRDFQVSNPNASSVQMVIKKPKLNSMGLGSDFLFFKFPIQAFEGEIINDANKLVVIVSGGKEQFKKLHLKK